MFKLWNTGILASYLFIFKGLKFAYALITKALLDNPDLVRVDDVRKLKQTKN
jgi:hypothetical protein